jgi:hypothetical protein
MKLSILFRICAGAVVLFSLGHCSSALALGPAPEQDAAVKHVNVAIIPANPEDVGTIDAIIRVSYEAISGGVGVPRQWARERTLNDPHSIFVSAEVDPKTGKTVIERTDDQEFADQSDALMVKEGFTERELGHVVHRFGNVATVVSSYEGKSELRGKVVDRGVNIFNLYFDGKRWWILSIVWDSERPDNPIPAELLPKS